MNSIDNITHMLTRPKSNVGQGWHQIIVVTDDEDAHTHTSI